MGDLADPEWMKGEANPVTKHFFNESVPWRLNEQSVIVDFGSGFGKLCHCLSLQAWVCGFRPSRILHVEIVGSYLAVDARVLRELQRSSEEGAVPVGGGSRRSLNVTHQEVRLM
jgi:hypothetical protein